MIEKRVLFIDSDGPFWTGPIHNPRALTALLARFEEHGLPCQVLDESIGGPLADGSFRRALGRGSGFGRMAWGPDDCYSAEVALADQPSAPRLAQIMPPARSELHFAFAGNDDVYGGFPLLDAQPPADLRASAEARAAAAAGLIAPVRSAFRGWLGGFAFSLKFQPLFDAVDFLLSFLIRHSPGNP